MSHASLSAMDEQNDRALVQHVAIAAFEDRLKKSGGHFLRAVPSLSTTAEKETETVKVEAEKTMAIENKKEEENGSTSKANAMDCSPVYRLADADDAECARVAAAYDGDNFFAVLRRLCARRGGSFLCAYRPVKCVAKEEMVHVVTGKRSRMDVTHFGETVRFTYADVWRQITCFGNGLAALGVPPASNVAIFLDTCVEWFIGIYGIWSQGHTTVTVYANLGESALAYALHETNASAILCGPQNVLRLMRLMQDSVVQSMPIIHTGTIGRAVDACGISLCSFDDLIAKGAAHAEMGLASGQPSTNPDDLALIMYTSGTTGTPKGVVHTHGSLACGLEMIRTRVFDVMGEPEEGESYCSYLPMAHIMEFTITNIFIQRGALIGFGTPRTLTDATARPHGDLNEYKPHFFVGVPRIFDTLKKAIESKLPPPGSQEREIFDHAYASRLKSLKEGKDTPFWNEKVFATTRALVGGHMKACLSGGGPISAATQEFVRVVFGPCVTGYGLTETVCVGVIQLPGDMETLCGGLIEPGEEIKLLDTEHYKHTDTPEPRGELCMRGSFLFKEYYKQPELTKEAIDEDGWFHTGDVASITKDGKLRLVGRVKALAKNSLGEYIAMEALEALYSGNALVQPNGVCVLVHPDKNYIAAVALTDEDKAMAFAKANNIEGTWPSILDKAEFQEAAARSLAQTAKDANRAPFECVRHVRVVNDEWTPENDILTAALKLKRRSIDVKYAGIIEGLFAEE